MDHPLRPPSRFGPWRLPVACIFMLATLLLVYATLSLLVLALAGSGAWPLYLASAVGGMLAAALCFCCACSELIALLRPLWGGPSR